MKNNLVNKILGLKTDDYQNRGRNYPTSNIPVSIETQLYNDQVLVNCSFKNTNEQVAEMWLLNELKYIGIDISKINIETCQEGDYEDDWVASYTNIEIKNLN